MVSGYKKSEIGLVPNDWDVLPFGEVFRTLSNNTLSRDQLNYDSGSIKDVHYGDVLILFPELLDCSRDDIPYVNSDAPLSCQSLQEGDVIISDTAEDETVGKAVEIVNQGKTNMVAGLHTIPCRVKNEKFASGWLGYFINSHYYHDQLLPYIHGTKVSSIARESLADTYIVKPSYEEQKRIVKALSDIGRLISESEELIAKYQAMKQGCLQHMFPRKDQTEPDMRLPGFSGAWEQRKLGDVCEIKDSARIPNSEWTESGVPYIRASDVTNENIDGVLFISQERYEFYKNRTGAPTKDDVLFNGGGEIGKCLLIADENPIYVQGGAVLYACTSKSSKLVGQYLKIYFETTHAKSYIDTASAGGTMKHFTLKPSQMMPILIPSVNEQEKLGTYFSNLDHLITLHQRKCEKYKMIKQGMMEELLTGKVRLK